MDQVPARASSPRTTPEQRRRRNSAAVAAHLKRRVEQGKCRYAGCNESRVTGVHCQAHRLQHNAYARAHDRRKRENVAGHVTSQQGETHHDAVLKAADIPMIRRRLRNGEKQTAIARDYKVSSQTISAVKRGLTWAHVPEEEG